MPIPNQHTLAIQPFLERLRNNKLFETFVMVVIIVSALLIGAKTYDVSEAVIVAIFWMDWAITGFFLLEITVRFLAEDKKRRFFLSAWNVFDTLIVVVSLIPIDDSEMALLGRLIRVFRVLRMVSVVPELRMLLNSLLKALPQLGYVVALMFIIFYIYGAMGSMFFANINEVLWGDIAISMLTLFRVMTFEDWTDIMYETMEVYPLSWCYYLSFIFFSAFAFLNMVIGIVVRVVDDENTRMQAAERGHMPCSLDDLREEIRELKELVQDQQQKGG